MSDSFAKHHDNYYLRNCIMGGRLPGMTLQPKHYAIGNQLIRSKHPEFRNNALSQRDGAYTHGNYIADGDGMQWDPGTADRSLPNSYYLSRKPFWFGDLNWPPFGGDIVDALPDKINRNRTPAQVRYWTMLYPEATPSGFNAVASGGSVTLSWTSESDPGRRIEFIICRSSDNENFQRIHTTAETIYVDSPDGPGKYSYYVRTRNFLGDNGIESDRDDLGVGGESDPTKTIKVTMP